MARFETRPLAEEPTAFPLNAGILAGLTSSSGSGPHCCSDPGLTEVRFRVCFRGFFRGLGCRFWSSGPDKFAPPRSVPGIPGDEVAERVVDPEEELPASSLRESGRGGGVSGAGWSLSPPSRLLRILGRLGELESSLGSSRGAWNAK